MKSKIAKLLSIIIFISITTLSSITVYADTKEYEIPNASFYVTLLENGDAVIREVWEVKYTKGNFTRFYKDIYSNVTPIEDFSSISITNCKINGTDVPATTSMNRMHNHCYIETTTDAFSINWFYKASNQTVEYETTYLLSDIIKNTDNNKALFSYRFIGANFEKKVKNTYVNITLPNDSSIELKYGKQDTYNTNNNSIILKQKNVKNLLRYSIAMDSSIFNDLQFIPSSSIDFEEKNKNNILSITNIIALIPIILICCLVLLIILERKKQNKFNTFIFENPTYIDDLIDKYESINPLILLNSNKYYISTYKKFIITLLDLCRRGEAYISKENLIINKHIVNVHNFEKNTLNCLLKYFKYDDNGDHYSFDLNNMGEVLKTSYKSKRFSQSLNDAYKSIPKNTSYINNDEIDFLRRYFRRFDGQYNNPAFDYFKIIERTETIDYILILGFAFVNIKRPIISDSDFPVLENVCKQLDYSILNRSSSTSSSSYGYYSSCSSCSSCGGCGGGGAD